MCPWGEPETGGCEVRQDHLYDFIAPTTPWEPVGDSAQLAGWSLLVLALALALLPWALAGRRFGVVSTVALGSAVLALVDMGVATLRSGLGGSVVEPVAGDAALYVGILVTPALLVRFAFAGRGWSQAAMALLVLGTPLVAGFSYAIGSYDARPWYEAISGVFTAIAGLCLVGAATFRGRPRTHEGAAPVGSTVPQQ